MTPVDVTQRGIAVDVSPWFRRDRWRHSLTLTLWIGEDPLPVWVTLLHESRLGLGPVEWYQSDTRLRLTVPPWVRLPGKRSWVTSLSGYRCPHEGGEPGTASFLYIPLAFDPYTQATPRALQATPDGIAYTISWEEDPLEHGRIRIAMTLGPDWKPGLCMALWDENLPCPNQAEWRVENTTNEGLSEMCTPHKEGFAALEPTALVRYVSLGEVHDAPKV